MNLICVSIKENTTENVIRSLKGLELAEVRLDALKELKEGDMEKIFSQSMKLIATYRPDGKSDEFRKNILIKAIDSGAAYVDIEVESKDEYENEIVKKAKQKNCKVIVSYHNYEKTPPRGELEQIIQWCFESGADIAKIACKINSDRDNARLFGLLDSEKKIIIIGIGEKGKITRIVAPILGSQFTFSSLAVGKETADGQIEINTMKKAIAELRRYL
ncbi:MAG: type I 3-dehydroquinate dehydratase [Candidatus Micrarchaeota archaeon]|nr:type I 3-dehydroquinate dehydratase [Candidatus Micrarchaeota archaeon]